MTSEDRRKITIIGLGLIGGSIGLALKRAALSGLAIVGHDRERDAEAKAERIGAIDKGEHNLPRAVHGAGMIIVATPILAVREVFQQISPDLAEGAVVTDTASTKAHIMNWAADVLPSHVSFVGGHPMAGKEDHGIDNADAALFRDLAYCIVPSIDAAESAVKSVMGLANLIGATPVFMDAAEHDVYAAAVSHLPLAVSTALFNLIRSSPSWPDIGVMASSGFADATRLASTDPAMAHGIWATNREALIHWLERMSAELHRLRDRLKDAQDEALLEMFRTAQIQREEFLQNPPRRERVEHRGEVPSAGDALLRTLVGGWTATQMKRVQQIPELIAQRRELERAREQEAPDGKKVRHSLADKIAEDVRRDLEKLDQKRERGDRKRDDRPSGGSGQTARPGSQPDSGREEDSGGPSENP